MQTKSSRSKCKSDNAAMPGSTHPLAGLSADEFAALGGAQTVFVRTISAGELANFTPEAEKMPAELQFQLVMGADGEAVLITDSENALNEWLENNEVFQVLVH